MQKHGATDDSRRGQKLIIGPWQHGSRGGSMAGNHYFGVAADAMALGLDENAPALVQPVVEGRGHRAAG